MKPEVRNSIKWNYMGSLIIGQIPYFFKGIKTELANSTWQLVVVMVI